MVPQLTTVSGHGIALAFSPFMGFPDAVANQYLGLFNETNNGDFSNHVFAVELHTILSPKFANIYDNHVEIDMNNLQSIESILAAYYSSKEEINKSLHLISGDPMQVWIEYDGVEKQLNVTLAPLYYPKPEIPLLSTSLDLSSVFMDSVYVGFSSSTGAIASSHYILGWSFNRSDQAQELRLLLQPPVTSFCV
ncbi:PREDICTED: L-type lectin-domain containing receptor kinase V.9 [Nelumbo nucifera]|uniref:L-type lectin-domain containing receptor kinase V.9 n=2 Tax=Nelumbo nucifera TaxID=4432 RepID=A0A1U8Q9A5_NELNU|nr:PREDICTED: L-type lectin-domain containing receptor kinase V.9 [Nelumbo nucifera]DAD24565.1 TPA_asm: hypothetical protein HUJ06_026029 [Nelumbo nucifera]